MNNLYRGPAAPLSVDGSTKTPLLQVNRQRVGAEKNGYFDGDELEEGGAACTL